MTQHRQQRTRTRRRTRTDPFRWTFADGSSPAAPHVASMTWRDGSFLNWPVDPDALRSHVPDELTLETYDGDAWLSVLPFVLTNAGIRGSPPIARTAVAELNARTYVRHRGDPGLFFFSIDVGSPLVAATVGRTTRLPVYHAHMRVGANDEGVAFSSTRSQTAVGARPRFDDDQSTARFSATYQPDGDVFTPEPGTLAHWLVERRRFYAAEENRGVLSGEIAHDPWPLQPATVTIDENTMFVANDLPAPTGDPVVYYCDELRMTGSIPRRLRDRR
ncbi:YqjF family protein [Natronorubrum sp. DTA28]|uniref:YqjF family protein n=1 Tax=Natronorubrum sp. DTA28 TaxID=3447019 RepID=UPI003F82F03C